MSGRRRQQAAPGTLGEQVVEIVTTPSALLLWAAMILFWYRYVDFYWGSVS